MKYVYRVEDASGLPRLFASKKGAEKYRDALVLKFQQTSAIYSMGNIKREELRKSIPRAKNNIEKLARNEFIECEVSSYCKKIIVSELDLSKSPNYINCVHIVKIKVYGDDE